MVDTPKGRKLRRGDKSERREARDALKMLRGDAPYNGGGNPCQGDGYYAASLRDRYGMPVHEIEKLSGYKSDGERDASKNKVIKHLRAQVRELKAEIAELKDGTRA